MSGTSEKKKQEPALAVNEVARALAAPFGLEEIRFKATEINGNRALVTAYVDARAIQNRLDAVLGVMGWQDSYQCLADGSVLCQLRLRFNNEWITKMDVGGPSDQPDSGDRLKAAFSSALKRAAVKFGIGRYLYRVPLQWVDYDPAKQAFVRTPQLPAWALPAKEPVKQPAGKQGSQAPPANGKELQKRLRDYDSRLAAQGLCAPGALVQHIVETGVKAGLDRDLTTWSEKGISLAADETRAFESQARTRKGQQKAVA
jgi:hypothetical protein